MLLDCNYKTAVFGDFDDLGPSSDNIVKMINELKMYNVIPATFSEVNVSAPVGKNQVKPLSRILLFSESRKIKIFIGTKRIDIEIIPKDYRGIMSDEIGALNNTTKDVFQKILCAYNKKLSRFAFTKASLLIELPEEKKATLINKYIYKSSYFTRPLEWSMRLVKQDKVTLSGIPDILNVITVINTVSGQIRKPDGIENFSGFRLDFDINTIAENIDLRYTYNEITDFLLRSESLAKTITDEIIGDII